MRHQAREYALQALYQAEMQQSESTAVTEAFLNQLESSDELVAFTQNLVQGTQKHKAELDVLIIRHLEQWKLSRLSILCRSLLRMAAYEILKEDTPPMVVIDEAVKLSLTFIDEQSHTLINRVLQRIYDGTQSNTTQDLSRSQQVSSPSAPKNIMSYAAMIEQIEANQKSHPDNLMARFFDSEYFNSLTPELQERFSKIIATGVQNSDSIMGAYAMYPDDYDVFKPYLNQLICAYHGIDGEVHHVSDWKKDSGETATKNPALDLCSIDPSFQNISMRVRVGRNLSDFPLPGAMNKEDRIRFENKMIQGFEALKKNPDFGGGYSSITPGSPYEISSEQYNKLVAEHKMFKDMSADPYLSVAGISSDWPHGRGIYISEQEDFIIWVGEEDHLRIMAMKCGSMLNEIFDRLQTSLAFLEAQGLEFASSDSYGYVTSCPTNLGSGMRASLHLALPKLTQNGSNVDALKPIAKKLGLSVRGAGGEHTAAGEGGIVDISPSARLQITESEICNRLFAGVQELWKQETQ